MRCSVCTFDDKLPIAEDLGGAIKIYPSQRAELIADIQRRKSAQITQNGLVQSYHIGHLLGILDVEVTKDGWLNSRVVVQINQKVADQN